MQEIKNIAVHHFGAPKTSPLYPSSRLTEKSIEMIHSDRDHWPGFVSELNGSHIGYNFIIWRDGS